MKVIPYSEAKATGLKTYYTGRPCVHGHDSPRNVNSRVCRECHRGRALLKARADPEAHREKSKAWKRKFPERHNEYKRNRYNADRVAARERMRDLKYGLATDQFSAMLDAQDYCCSGCSLPFFDTPQVDHNHTTGAVRGLLCGSCNRAIGMVDDNIATLQSLIRYLEDHQSTLS